MYLYLNMYVFQVLSDKRQGMQPCPEGSGKVCVKKVQGRCEEGAGKV